LILSIESSCDDSSIAITSIDSLELLFHKKISQEKEHSVYGGVVPELASRLHAVFLPQILLGCKEYLPHIKAVAVTNEPGLSVTLMEGVMMARALSISLGVPTIEVNHLVGHIYSLFIEKESLFPLSILLVSGGHTMICRSSGLDNIEVVASTIDDSFGESFDKCAKLLGLGYPGGPIVERYASGGDEDRFSFPLPLKGDRLAFSYSGLKNAFRLEYEKLETSSEQDRMDICASFQKRAIEHIVDKTKLYFKNSGSTPENLAIVGGAAANLKLRDEMEKLCQTNGKNLICADLKYCSDNAAMIGRVGVDMYKKRIFCNPDMLKVNPSSTKF